jgi:hypothetical protein
MKGPFTNNRTTQLESQALRLGAREAKLKSRQTIRLESHALRLGAREAKRKSTTENKLKATRGPLTRSYASRHIQHGGGRGHQTNHCHIKGCKSKKTNNTNNCQYHLQLHRIAQQLYDARFVNDTDLINRLNNQKNRLKEHSKQTKRELKTISSKQQRRNIRKATSIQSNKKHVYPIFDNKNECINFCRFSTGVKDEHRFKSMGHGIFVCMGTDEPYTVRRHIKETEIGWEASETGVHSHTDVATGKKKFLNHAEISKANECPPSIFS